MSTRPVLRTSRLNDMVVNKVDYQLKQQEHFFMSTQGTENNSMITNSFVHANVIAPKNRVRTG